MSPEHACSGYLDTQPGVEKPRFPIHAIRRQRASRYDVVVAGCARSRARRCCAHHRLEGLTVKKLAKLKIKLNPETIRDLTTTEIGQVVGGVVETQPSNGTGCKTCG